MNKKSDDLGRQFKCSIEVSVHDKEGNEVSKHTQGSRSFLRLFGEFMLAQIRHPWSGAESECTFTAPDIDDVSRDTKLGCYTGSSRSFRGKAEDDTAAFGLIVGSGDTAVAKDDTKLDAMIAHGTGSGQLDYNDTSVTAIEQDGDVSSITLTRTFTNSSGGIIVVKEMGWAGGFGQAAGSWGILMLRDVLITPQSIPNSMVLTLRLKITWTYHAD